MKNIKLIIFTSSLIMISAIATKTHFYFKRLSVDENIKIRESFEVLNKCFDLENKNKRSLNESIELIEYCLIQYGYKN